MLSGGPHPVPFPFSHPDFGSACHSSTLGTVAVPVWAVCAVFCLPVWLFLLPDLLPLPALTLSLLFHFFPLLPPALLMLQCFSMCRHFLLSFLCSKDSGFFFSSLFSFVFCPPLVASFFKLCYSFQIFFGQLCLWIHYHIAPASPLFGRFHSLAHPLPLQGGRKGDIEVWLQLFTRPFLFGEKDLHGGGLMGGEGWPSESPKEPVVITREK